MNNFESVRWMLTFYHSQGSWKEEADFPQVDFWHPDEKTSQKEAARVLRELKERGDTRDWRAAGHPDPFKVGSGQHPGGQWILPPPPPRIFEPDKAPAMDSSEEDWDAFDRALRESRGSREP